MPDDFLGRLPEIDRTLLACLAGRPDDVLRLDADGWGELVERAAALEVATLLYGRLMAGPARPAIPAAVKDALQQQYAHTMLYNTALYAKLGALLAAFERAAIPAIVLQGAYLAEAVYNNLGLRPMSNIDLLVRPADAGRAAEELAGLDYEPAGGAAAYHAGYCLRGKLLGVELFWDLPGPRTGRGHWLDELWRRCLPAGIARSHACALAPEDLLLMLCWHAAGEHGLAYLAFRALCDVAQVVAVFRSALDWPCLAATASRWGMAVAAYVMLDCARAWLAAPVPAATLQALRPRPSDARYLAAAYAEILYPSAPGAAGEPGPGGPVSLGALRKWLRGE